jgi:hypothetical protein
MTPRRFAARPPGRSAKIPIHSSGLALIALILAALAGFSTTNMEGALAARAALLRGGIAFAGIVGILFFVHQKECPLQVLLCLAWPFRLCYFGYAYKTTGRVFMLAMIGIAAIAAAVRLPFQPKVIGAAPPAIVQANPANVEAAKAAPKQTAAESDGPRAKRLLNDQIAILRELTALLKNVRDVRSARAAPPELAKLRAKLNQNQERLKQPFNVTDADEASLEGITQFGVAPAAAAYDREARRAAGIPGVRDALNQIEQPKPRPMTIESEHTLTQIVVLNLLARVGTAPSIDALERYLSHESERKIVERSLAQRTLTTIRARLNAASTNQSN